MVAKVEMQLAFPGSQGKGAHERHPSLLSLAKPTQRPCPSRGKVRSVWRQIDGTCQSLRPGLDLSSIQQYAP
jgi:hypothetical protein